MVAFAPGPQAEAALAAGIREAHRRRWDVVIASHAYHDAENGRMHAERPEVLQALARALSLATPEDRQYFESIDITIEESSGADVGEFLLSVAEKRGAELLVLGLRGKSQSGKLHLGSFIRRVLLGAVCPVLVVKTDAARDVADENRT